MYTGKEVCQGCNKPGVESPRVAKNSLCKECKPLLKIGMAVNFEESTKYTLVRDWDNGYSGIDSGDKSLDFLGNRLMESLDNPSAETSSHIDFTRTQPFGSRHYKIPTKVAEPLNMFLDGLNKRIKEIKEIRINAEEFARQAVSLEKDKIFNEGVSKGRDLLFSLNRGDITVEDFNKKLTR